MTCKKTIVTVTGEKSTRFVKALLKPGDSIRMEFDAEKRDRCGWLLAYVHFSDGRMLNEEIVMAGYASLLTHPPNVKYEQRFLQAYREERVVRTRSLLTLFLLLYLPLFSKMVYITTANREPRYPKD